MATGNSLLVFTPLSNEPPASNYAQIGFRNLHPVLDFNDTTQWAAVFSAVLPRHYGGGGFTVYLHWSAVAVSGTVGWDVAIERNAGSHDVDADSFATAATVTAATVPGTSGVISVTNVVIADGANIDGVAAGELFRIRIRRDVANDTAAGDAELHAIEIKET